MMRWIIFIVFIIACYFIIQSLRGIQSERFEKLEIKKEKKIKQNLLFFLQNRRGVSESMIKTLQNLSLKQIEQISVDQGWMTTFEVENYRFNPDVNPSK